jgi:ABC-type multidrug transport system ATPase subunit
MQKMVRMQIKLSDAGKRFNREWIFRNTDLEFNTGNAYAITGPNGSGKSTLLQIIGGMLLLSEGSIRFLKGNAVIPEEKIYQHISFCAPYLDVIEEMTLWEFFKFHSKFKKIIAGYNAERIIEKLELSKARQKQIRNFSSGMKQRVKLGQAFFSDTPILLLDEPCTNLDADGIELYHQLIIDHCQQRIVFVSSNDIAEYSFCNQNINMAELKK